MFMGKLGFEHCCILHCLKRTLQRRMNPQAAVPEAPDAGSAKSGLRKMTTTAPDKELGRSRLSTRETPLLGVSY